MTVAGNGRRGPAAGAVCALVLLSALPHRVPPLAAPKPTEVAAMRHLAHALIRDGNYDAAVEAYRSLVLALPHDPRAHTDLAGTLAWLRRYAEAEEPAREAVRLAPREAQVHALLATVLVNLGREREAFAALRRGAELGDRTAMWELHVCYEQGRGIEADPSAALVWAERAAAAGHVAAMDFLARVFTEGLSGRAPDPEQAALWRRRARAARAAPD